jgi:hypothetical protein
MYKVKFAIIFLFISLFSSFAQGKKFPLAVGVSYERIDDCRLKRFCLRKLGFITILVTPMPCLVIPDSTPNTGIRIMKYTH